MTDSANSNQSGRRGSDETWLNALGWCASHTVGVLVVAGVLMLALTNPTSRRAIVRGLQDGAYPWDTAGRIAVHLLLSAVVWGVGYAGWRAFAGREASQRTASRGAVMLETVVVFPVAVFLIMGLAQLGIINIAATLTNFAAYEATRTAWVWEGERNANRMGASITEEKVEEYAKIQAALVLTPVAPGAFTQGGWPNLPRRANQARGMMVGAQIPVPYHDSGDEGLTIARGMRSLSMETPGYQSSTFAIAFDPSSHLRSTVRKFTWAYQAVETDMTVDGQEGTLSLELKYHHFCAFPVVAYVFGDKRPLAGREGYYKTITRTIERERELPAHGKWPKWQSGDIDRTINYF